LGAHAIILNPQEAEIRGISIQGQLQQKVSKTLPPQPIKAGPGVEPVIPTRIKEDQGPGQPGHKLETLLEK
jgi:hypothetical protein